METFKIIDNYRDYTVSDRGNVISLKGEFTSRTLKQQDNGKGYLGVGLSDNGKTTRFLVHRLVAEAFISNDNGLPEVNHIDENKSNNNVENLEWSTHKDNISHSCDREFYKSPVTQWDNTKRVIAVWPSIYYADSCGFNKAGIRKCIIGLSDEFKGFNWTVGVNDEDLINQHFIDMRALA